MLPPFQGMVLNVYFIISRSFMTSRMEVARLDLCLCILKKFQMKIRRDSKRSEFKCPACCKFNIVCTYLGNHGCSALVRILFPGFDFSELYSRDWLDLYLSRALGVPLDLEKKRLTLIDESNYILTLDFALKMLNIHERAECGVPVIIEGETGVGKTFLIDMLSKLWNYSLYKHWAVYTDRMVDFIKSSKTSKHSSMSID